MSHHCHDHDHDHDHSHDAEGILGPSDSLQAIVDIDNAVALNSNGDVKVLFRSWDRRMNEQQIQSDDDPELIIRVPFTGVVNLKALLLRAGPGDETPSSISIFANRDDLDFTNVDEVVPTQKIDVPISEGIGEYTLTRAKFSNVNSITLSFSASQGAEILSLQWVAFLGTYVSARKGPPTNIVYESQANLADHQKIKGTEEGLHKMGH